MFGRRRHAAPVRQRRFYAEARMEPSGGAFVLHLDGKRAMTPGRRVLAVADPRLADARRRLAS